MGYILFHDYKSKADTPEIKVDFVFLIQSTTRPDLKRVSCQPP